MACGSPAPRRLEPEARVVARVPLKEDDRHISLGHDLQTPSDQPRTDALPLPHGQHRDRAQYVDIDEPTRGVQEAGCEHHVPDDLSLVLGDRGERVLRPHRVAQPVDEVGYNGPKIAERREVQVPDGRSILAMLRTKVHDRDGTTPADRSPMGNPDARHP